MKPNYLPYLILSLIAGLTVGVIVAVFASLSALVYTFIAFPIQVFLASTQRLRELEDVKKNEDMWDRHIRRMEENKHDNNQ